MKLLILTQTIDTTDPVLGFFVRWVEEFSKHVESVEVICLREGKYSLPANVRVHSLGKEREGHDAQHEAARFARHLVLRAKYAFRFLSLVWRLRHSYDSVFVHMNQEYILLSGVIWKMLKKRVYLWRNHYAGSLLTDIAVFYCNKVFCTSKYSYTAKYKKTLIMPVGVDTQRFNLDSSIHRKAHSILSLSRISPSKHIEVFIDALIMLDDGGVNFSANIVGSELPKYKDYYKKLYERARPLLLSGKITFNPGVQNDATPEIYRAHTFFVNTSKSGMFDKTLFEAAACGDIVLSSSKDFAKLAGIETYFDDASTLNKILRGLLVKSSGEISKKNLSNVVQQHSLTELTDRLLKEIIL